MKSKILTLLRLQSQYLFYNKYIPEIKKYMAAYVFSLIQF